MAKNIRIVYDNAADRATITASSTAGSLSASNLKVDMKSAVWRSTSTSATLTATWATGEVVSAVVLPFCNLTSQATVRVRGYTNAADATPAFDTGAVFACPALSLGLWGWGSDSLGVNAFAYGGGTYGRVWVNTPSAVQKLTIDISDPSNLAGYIECSRLIAGAYWEPEIGPEAGNANLSISDTSKHYRTDAGDTFTDVGNKYRKQSFSLPWLGDNDRLKMWNILWGNGMARPIFISMYPNNTDVALEQANQLYGKLVTSPVMSTPYFNKNSATIELEEV